MAHSTNARGTDTKLKESSSSAEKRPALPRIPQVALLLETSTEYGRGLLRGILRYAKLYGPWSLSFAPGHLDQVLPAAGAWSGAGIIARIHSSKMEKRLRSMRLPMVASLLTEAPPASPTSRYGEIRTDSIAIARMGATHLIGKTTGGKMSHSRLNQVGWPHAGNRNRVRPDLSITARGRSRRRLSQKRGHHGEAHGTKTFFHLGGMNSRDDSRPTPRPCRGQNLIQVPRRKTQGPWAV